MNSREQKKKITLHWILCKFGRKRRLKYRSKKSKACVRNALQSHIIVWSIFKRTTKKEKLLSSTSNQLIVKLQSTGLQFFHTFRHEALIRACYSFNTSDKSFILFFYFSFIQTSIAIKNYSFLRCHTRT